MCIQRAICLHTRAVTSFHSDSHLDLKTEEQCSSFWEARQAAHPVRNNSTNNDNASYQIYHTIQLKFKHLLDQWVSVTLILLYKRYETRSEITEGKGMFDYETVHKNIIIHNISLKPYNTRFCSSSTSIYSPYPTLYIHMVLVEGWPVNQCPGPAEGNVANLCLH